MKEEIATALPDVSVLIAAYNCANFVSRAVNSALSQDGVVVEVIVVDDCSTDATKEVVGKISESDRRVRLVRSEVNGGPGAARNIGIAHATGRWIAVLDADDAFENDRLLVLSERAEAGGADIIADNFTFFDALTERKSAPAIRTSPASELINAETFLAAARPYNSEADFGLLKPLVSRRFLVESGIWYPTKVRHGEDFHFVLDLLLAKATYLLVRENVGYIYTTRSSGWSRTVIDDTGMIRTTAALLDRANVKESPVLQSLIVARVKALRRLELDRFANLPSEVRPRALMLRRAATSFGGWKWLLARVAMKLAIKSGKRKKG